MTPKLQQLIELHAALLEQNPYCYFELAYTRQTEWMAWICTNAREADPARKILAKGQGDTPEEAADAALECFGSNDKAQPRAESGVNDSKNKRTL